MKIDTVAWMGGSSPKKLSTLSHKERGLVSFLFAEQVAAYSGGWGEFPNLDVCRIFWNRARHDAHATCRRWACS